MPKDSIGPKIKALRKGRGLTQEQLAKDLGYSHKSVVTHIEKGESEMSYEKILLLLRTYHIDANELFDQKYIDRIDDLLGEERNKAKHDKVVVYLHGLHGSAKEIDEYRFLSKWYDLKGLDYEDGNPWEVGPIIQAKFKELIAPYKEVVVIANSIGAFYAYEYLGDFPINHAFFISPIASMSKILFDYIFTSKILFDYIFTGQVSEKELEEKKFVTAPDGTLLSYGFYQKYRFSDYHGHWDVETDLLRGSRDELVYIENIEDFLKAHPQSKLTILEGAEHYIHDKEEMDFVRDWIARTLRV